MGRQCSNGYVKEWLWWLLKLSNKPAGSIWNEIIDHFSNCQILM